MSDQYMTVSWPYALEQILILDQLGFPRRNSYKVLGLDIDKEPSSAERLAARHFNKVFETAEIVLNDPLIGLRVGYEFRISNFAKTGNIYSYCKDLGEVLTLNARYQPIAVEIGKITTVIEPENAAGETRYFLDYDLYCEDFHSVRHVFGLIFGAYATAFRWLTWSSAYELKAVYFQQEAPVDAELFERIFQCPLYFNQAYNRIEFFEESMTAPLSTQDPVRKAQMMAQLDGFIASQDAQVSFKRSLRATIKQAIANGRSNLPSIAESLGLSETKFRQKLKDADVKYRSFLDDVRQELFDQKFAQGLSFAQIAQDLGYNDQAAFTRAFKRWHGVTPGQFMQDNTRKETAPTS